MKIVVSLLTGLMFGLGLIVAGMVNPAKVLGFLDITGAWDPSLVFVMVGGIGVAAAGFHFAKKQRHALLGGAMDFPSARGIDQRLVVGSLMFGVGWGIAGFCPGPAVVSVGAGSMQAMIFTAAMLLGMVIFAALNGFYRRSS
ncbi:hypothetical protein DTO96_101210 [Ephemeroptericola cinctiostellae]|uniref:Uncharacterized protein n=1 Tax=Ephemeroptericola cinctiostellae TaxID=2268024 RepID=A0A345DAU1_9BURK|nr:DUF6691 family protein [Ephemeroptericola cinctiostellae]AXF85479.1 hypothetical protein DTO96_101210 [Ephemeroptericola cinctiostellae]